MCRRAAGGPGRRHDGAGSVPWGPCSPTTPSTSRPSASTGTRSTRTCRFLLDRYLPDPADRAFAEEHVAAYGTLVGQAIAPRAEETDKHGPVLRRYDRWGYDVDRWSTTRPGRENKADLVRNGFVSLEPRRPPGPGRGHRLHLLSGLPGRDGHLLRAGHDAGAADIVERHDRPTRSSDLVDGSRSLDPAEPGRAGCS